jgi:DNA-binding MarR family transcriptional regulator
MKQEFIDFIDALIAAAPDVAKELMTDEVKAYLEALKQSEDTKPLFTDNGKLVLQGMQKLCADGTTMMKAKDIGDELFISSRTVSGALRKLVNDDFVEKIGQNPVIYTLTEKGKNYNFEE